MPDDVFRDLSWTSFVRMALRLLAAVALGAAIGWEREIHHRWAGLRTHILVAVGTAAVMVLACEMESADPSAPSRTMQGVVAGIGFIGGGAILKLETERRIEGLTTAAGIWATAGIGMAVGSGWLVLGITGTVLVLCVLWIVRLLEYRRGEPTDADERPSDGGR